MICEGYPLKEVAHFIQEDKKEYTEIKRESLVWLLDDYRKTIPKAELIGRRMPPVFAKAANKVRESIDELEEMQKLYVKQMERLEIDLNNEKKIGKLLTSMPQEIKQAKDILQAIAQLKMDLGLSKRHLGQIDVDARVMADVQHRYNNTEVVKVMENPESRRKLLGIAQQFLALTKKPIDVEAEEVVEEASTEAEPSLEHMAAEAIDEEDDS